jgi:hypothetical protein
VDCVLKVQKPSGDLLAIRTWMFWEPLGLWLRWRRKAAVPAVALPVHGGTLSQFNPPLQIASVFFSLEKGEMASLCDAG